MSFSSNSTFDMKYPKLFFFLPKKNKLFPLGFTLSLESNHHSFWGNILWFQRRDGWDYFLLFQEMAIFFPARFSKLYILAKWRQIFNALANQFVFLQTAWEACIQNMNPQSMNSPCGPRPWTLLWTRSMDYPCGPPLILKINFYQRS